MDHKEENKRKIRTEESVHDDKLQYTEATDSDDATTEAESKRTLLPKQKAKQNKTEPAEILSGTLYVGEQAEDGSTV